MKAKRTKSRSTKTTPKAKTVKARSARATKSEPKSQHRPIMHQIRQKTNTTMIPVGRTPEQSAAFVEQFEADCAGPPVEIPQRMGGTILCPSDKPRPPRPQIQYSLPIAPQPKPIPPQVFAEPKKRDSILTRD